MGAKRSKRHANTKIPPEMHERIAEWCAKPNDRGEDGKAIPKTGGLAYAQAQCAADGLKVSIDTLSRFFAWWQLEQDLEISFEREEQVLAKTGDAKKAREAGEALLMRLGLAKQDPELIVAAAKVHDSRRGLDLDEKSGKTKAAHKERSLSQKDQEIKIAQTKLMRDNCELFVKWSADEKTKEILTSGASKSDQIEALGRHMYGEDWDQ